MSSTRDPYLVLGINNRSASADEVKKAYHKLAKLYHPDRNSGDKKAEGKLKEANAAYAILGDKNLRTRFDAGEIDADGQERIFNYQQYREPPRHNAHGHSTHGPGSHSQQQRGFGSRGFGQGARNFFDENDFTTEDIISSLFGGGKKRGQQQQQRHTADEPLKPGKDINYTLKLPFIEATLGGKRTIELSGGKEVALAIPPGTTDGTRLRLKGQGVSARSGGPSGDAYIEITVEPHPLFKRDGDNIACEVPVSLQEAVLGGSIRVPTLSGLVDVKVPKNSNTGTVLRLKGKGVQKTDGSAGDQFVRLKVVLPEEPDDSLVSFLKQWTDASGFNPRKKAGME